jgi:hypothetical protein
MNSKALEKASHDIVVAAPDQDVIKMAAVLSRAYSQPKDPAYQLSNVDFLVATEMVLAYGLHPATVSKDFHIWKDRTGAMRFQLHFARNARWAQAVESFRVEEIEWTTEQKKNAPGIRENDFVWDMVIIRKSQERDYQNIFRTIMDAAKNYNKSFDEALALAKKEALKIGTAGTGVCRYNEVFDDKGNLKTAAPGIIPGRVPGHARAKIRGLTDAIKKAYGTPSRADMQLAGMGLRSPTGNLAHDLADMPEEITMEPEYIQQRYIELSTAQTQALSDHAERIASLSPEERKAEAESRVASMRGDGSEKDPNWLDEAIAEVGLQPGEVVVTEGEPVDNFSPEEEVLVTRPAPVADAGGPIQVGTVRNALLGARYTRTQDQDECIRKIFGPDVTIDGLSEVQRFNVIQYALRVKILNDTSINPPEERLSRIPEIVSAKEPPKTLKHAKEFLKVLANALSLNDQKMKEIA